MMSSLETPDENSKLFCTSKLRLIDTAENSFMSNTTKLWKSKVAKEKERHHHRKSMTLYFKTKEKFNLEKKRIKFNKRNSKNPIFKIKGIEIYHKNNDDQQIHNLILNRSLKHQIGTFKVPMLNQFCNPIDIKKKQNVYKPLSGVEGKSMLSNKGQKINRISVLSKTSMDKFFKSRHSSEKLGNYSQIPSNSSLLNLSDLMSQYCKKQNLQCKRFESTQVKNHRSVNIKDLSSNTNNNLRIKSCEESNNTVHLQEPKFKEPSSFSTSLKFTHKVTEIKTGEDLRNKNISSKSVIAEDKQIQQDADNDNDNDYCFSPQSPSEPRVKGEDRDKGFETTANSFKVLIKKKKKK